MQPLCPELALKKDFRGTTVLQLRGHKRWLLLGGKTQEVSGVAVQSGRGQAKVQQTWARCGQRTLISALAISNPNRRS